MGKLHSRRRWGIAAVILLLVCLSAGALLLPRLGDRHLANRLFNEGKYASAREIYLRLGDEDRAARCAEILRDTSYHQARQAMQDGDYARAEQLFDQLGDYLDSRKLVPQCRFLRAGALCESGELDEAKQLYLALGDYPGCKEALEGMPARYYDKALSLAHDFDIEGACKIWRELGDFRNCKTLLKRGERILEHTADEYRMKVNDPSRVFRNNLNAFTYVCDEAYIVVPVKPDRDTRFFLYFPGGRNEELNLDFFDSYLLNPAPNTLAVFMRKNGLPKMQEGCEAALDFLDRAAADLGVFAEKLVVAGSSLGVYTAVQCPRWAWHEYGVQVTCVLSLDAGNDWWEPVLAPDVYTAEEIAWIGTELVLFQSPALGTEHPVIQRFVQAGDMVTIVECLSDEHEKISHDALSSGIVDWALGDRTDAFPSENYRWIILS